MSEFDDTDRSLLNILQSDFPLTSRPWEGISSSLGISSAEVIRRVGELERKNVIREINAIFDTRRLGYQSTLVAMRIPDERLSSSAARLNKHPGISHNYSRNGYFNLWFTLALPPARSLENEVAALARAAYASKTRMMPTLRFFKIGVNFDMKKQVSKAKGFAPSQKSYSGDISETDIQAVRLLQENLPLTEEPFAKIAAEMGMSHEALFDYIDGMVKRGLMRRYGAVLRHKRAGFSANAMAVWNVPEGDTERVGQIMAGFSEVTHCYQRPRYPDWRFSLFTMIHAVSREECEAISRRIQDATGVADNLMLYSTREYKKTRVRYFVEDDFFRLSEQLCEEAV